MCLGLVVFITAYLGISQFNWSLELNLYKLTKQYAYKQ